MSRWRRLERRVGRRDRAARRVANHFERELEALVAISSPSGDVAAAEEVCALVAALLPDEATIERPPCSTPGYAPDLLAPLARHRQPAGCCCSATSTRSSPTTSTGRSSAPTASWSARARST